MHVIKEAIGGLRFDPSVDMNVNEALGNYDAKALQISHMLKCGLTFGPSP